MKIFWTIVACIVVLFVAVLAVAYGGFVDVAATSADSAPVHWFLTTTREHAVESALNDVEVPPLDDPRLLRIGLEHYHEMCVTCHGAPGVEPAELAEGLNPRPPRFGRRPGGGPRPQLTDEQGAERKRRHDAETYWIVKHGLRMTGMPAFGPTHSEEDLWAMTAFVDRLRELSPDDYAAMVHNAGMELPTGEHEHGEEGGGEHAEGAPAESGAVPAEGGDQTAAGGEASAHSHAPGEGH